MNLFNIVNSFKQKKERGWSKIFWAIDLHDTIIEGKYNLHNVGANVFSGAAEVLSYLYSRPDMGLILWTSSHSQAVLPTMERLEKEHNIKFHYLNENPECQNTELCDFSDKFYFNILLDDKAGFDGHSDWLAIKNLLKSIGEWKKPIRYTITEMDCGIEYLYLANDADDDADDKQVCYWDYSKEDVIAWVNAQGGIVVT